MIVFIDYTSLDRCINPYSFGEICVGCNACGRWNKNTQKECALKVYKQQLKEQYEFNDWIEGMEEIQRKNIETNIKYLEKKIAELEYNFKNMEGEEEVITNG